MRTWLFMLLGAGAGFGQSFEVATVKLHDPQSPVTLANGYSPGRLTATGSLRDLMRLAYGVQDTQIAGGAGWTGSERFEIEGRAGSAAGFEQMRSMLQLLLADRFRLATHREARELGIRSGRGEGRTEAAGSGR